MSCPTTRYIACSSKAGSDQDVELTTVGWNVLIAAVFFSLAATANGSIWLGLVHLQSTRDIVVALDAGRVITAFVLAVYTVAFSFWSTTEDTILWPKIALGRLT